MLDWRRTGKITLRADPYLVIRYPSHYLALYGPQTARETIGRYDTAADAKKACQRHSDAVIGEKNPASDLSRVKQVIATCEGNRDSMA